MLFHKPEADCRAKVERFSLRPWG